MYNIKVKIRLFNLKNLNFLIDKMEKFNNILYIKTNYKNLTTFKH